MTYLAQKIGINMGQSVTVGEINGFSIKIKNKKFYTKFVVEIQIKN